MVIEKVHLSITNCQVGAIKCNSRNGGQSRFHISPLIPSVQNTSLCRNDKFVSVCSNLERDVQYVLWNKALLHEDG